MIYYLWLIETKQFEYQIKFLNIIDWSWIKKNIEYCRVEFYRRSSVIVM